MAKKIESEKVDEIEKEISEEKIEVKDGKEKVEAEIKEEKVLDKKPVKREKEIEAIVHLYTSFNNTLAHVTDMSGRTIAKVTGGMVTKHSRLKANPTIAMFIAKRISEAMKEHGVKSVYIKIRAKTGNPAPGPGANAVVKSLTKEGFKILNILDATRVPRGGPKKKGGRRGRRP